MPANKSVALSALTLTALFSSPALSTSHAEDFQYLHRIGLYGTAEYREGYSNHEVSEVEGMTQNGLIWGRSLRYNEEDNPAGTAAWVADATTGVTTRVGLVGGEFTSSFRGYQGSFIEHVTESGYVIGVSHTYVENSSTLSSFGEAIWVANATTGVTTRIGFFGEEFTDAEGLQRSFVVDVPAYNQYVIGTSYRYDHTNPDAAGLTAWLANAATGETIRIGFEGPEYVSSEGLQQSGTAFITENGYVGGFSVRYAGAEKNVQESWIRNISTGVTTRIGLYEGPEYTAASTGNQEANISGASKTGYVAGISARYDGDSSAGWAAWATNVSSSTIHRVGLYEDAEFISSLYNSQSSQVQGVSDSGYVTGLSQRYNGSTDNGFAAWVANATTGVTTRIGFYQGAEFSRADTNFQFSMANKTANTGLVVGISTRYSGSAENGQAAWVADATTGETTRVGLMDAAHTGVDNFQFSSADIVTESGLVGGYSQLYHGDATQEGQTAWVFDLNTNVTTVFALSQRASDGQAYSILHGITEAGLAYGSFTLYDGETDLGMRAFIWSADLGTLILDDVLSGGVAQYGWDFLMSANFSNLNGYLTGHAKPTDADSSSQGVYVVKSVPEPGTAALIGLGLAALLAGHRRRRN